MSNSVEKFVLKCKEDVAFMQKIAAMKTREEIIEAAKTEDIQLTVEDIDAVNETLKQETLKSIPKDTPAGQFINKMIEDKAFAEKVMAQTESEEVIRIAKESSISLTAEDLAEANKTIAALAGVAPAQQSYGELSEEDLEQVAGGTISNIITKSVAYTITSATVSMLSLSAVTMVSVQHVVDPIVNPITNFVVNTLEDNLK